MTQRFGGIYSVLNQRELVLLNETWGKMVDWGHHLPERDIDELESMTDRQVLAFLEEMTKSANLQSMMPGYGLDSESLQDFRKISSDLQRITSNVKRRIATRR